MDKVVKHTHTDSHCRWRCGEREVSHFVNAHGLGDKGETKDQLSLFSESWMCLLHVLYLHLQHQIFHWSSGDLWRRKLLKHIVKY